MSFVTEDGFWIEGDDGHEFIVKSLHLMHDEIIAERHAEILTMIEEFLKTNPLDKIIKIDGNKINNTNLMEEQNVSKISC